MQSTTVNDKRLEDAVSKVLTKLSVSLEKFEAIPDLTKGDNFMGEIRCIYIEGKDKNNENVKLNLVGKLAPLAKTAVIEMIQFVYPREIYMYETVLATIQSLQQSRNVTKPFQAYPMYYLSVDNNVMIMQNMKSLGFIMKDRQETLNYNHVSLIVKEIGKYHSLSFALRERHNELFDAMYGNTYGNMYDGRFKGEFVHLIMDWYSRAFSVLEEGSLAYEKYKTLKNKFYSIIAEFLSNIVDKKFSVIGHCDCWTPNMLFKYADPASNENPLEFCLLDWQCATRCSPVVDLSQVLFCCCDKELRKRHYKDLTDVYYTSFSSHLLQFGLDAKKLFPYEVFQQHLKTFSVAGLCLAIKTIYFTAIEALPDLHQGLERNMDPLSIFMNCKMDNEIYTRIKDVIVDFVEYGYEM